MVTKEGHIGNPQDVVLLSRERTQAIVNAIIDANDYIEKHKRTERHFGSYKAMDISNYRRLILIPRLRSYMKNLPGIELFDFHNTFFILFDDKVAMYIRKGNIDDMRYIPPKWMLRKNTILRTATMPQTMPLPFLEDEDETESDDVIELIEELRVRDLIFIIGIYIPDNEGKIAAFYIGTPKGEYVEDSKEIPLIRTNISLFDVGNDSETRTDFGGRKGEDAKDNEQASSE